MRISLTQGKYALVDDEDYRWLNLFRWHAQRTPKGDYYAFTTIDGKAMQMSRLLMDTPDGMICDHSNHATLDNRRDNLRNCTNAENVRNQRPRNNTSSKYKGVTWYDRDRKWLAQIMINNKQKHLGYFDNEVYAARVYNAAAQRLHGEFACLNEIIDIGKTYNLFA